MSDARWMAAALSLATRARAGSSPNPNVGCVIVDRSGAVVGRGWTQSGGRPHAEAMAVAQAGARAADATAYVTLEPCAHASQRGPECAGVLIDAGIARLVCAIRDPDPRTNGKGLARLRDAGVAVVEGVGEADARAVMAGWLMQQARQRPLITLKLATSLDGRIARPDGESRWITGPAARAHGHLERARSNAILVGRGTLAADAPRLDVRLAGLEDRTPQRLVLTSGAAPAGWQSLSSPEAVHTLPAIQWLLVEGGAGAAAAFLKADLVDRLLLYRAPILLGEGRAALGDIGLSSLAGAHGRWRLHERRALGIDSLEVYERVRKAD